ncbi:MAG: 2-amino-4-hydroxy-6-hydroxymethyldihydropteridine diphosphokinase [Candidatus Omnitrophica bacterium]|nr:2-amino-4-hydroxy-6-hydroxymethyldihydropteridine diphosphokinase [Candidatus Omnitrophota bacterium]
MEQVLAIVYLALGSNLGERAGNITKALKQLGQNGVEVVKVSSYIETDPVGGPPQGLFINAAAKVETFLSPRELLTLIHQIESSFGRQRLVKNGPRPIDIDILLYDNLQIAEPDLVIPHPRMKERDFVMRPLAEIF